MNENIDAEQPADKGARGWQGIDLIKTGGLGDACVAVCVCGSVCVAVCVWRTACHSDFVVFISCFLHYLQPSSVCFVP